MHKVGRIMIIFFTKLSAGSAVIDIELNREDHDPRNCYREKIRTT
jgi:hypothetical protein